MRYSRWKGQKLPLPACPFRGADRRPPRTCLPKWSSELASPCACQLLKRQRCTPSPAPHHHALPCIIAKMPAKHTPVAVILCVPQALRSFVMRTSSVPQIWSDARSCHDDAPASWACVTTLRQARPVLSKTSVQSIRTGPSRLQLSEAGTIIPTVAFFEAVTGERRHDCQVSTIGQL